MKTKSVRFKIWLMIIIGIVIVSFTFFFVILGMEDDIGACRVYRCDVKGFNSSTKIEIKDSGGGSIYTVKGNIITFVTDPLTMYDSQKIKVAYATDKYSVVAEDSHQIILDSHIMAEMVGLENIFDTSYDIYNYNSDKVAKLSVNMLNTDGEMYDIYGNLIADYNSKPLLKDFTVRIKDNTYFSDEAILIMFCSYFSDRSYNDSED